MCNETGCDSYCKGGNKQEIRQLLQVAEFNIAVFVLLVHSGIFVTQDGSPWSAAHSRGSCFSFREIQVFH